MTPTRARQQPVLLVIDDDPAALSTIRRELNARYGRDYRVVSETSAAGAEQT